MTQVCAPPAISIATIPIAPKKGKPGACWRSWASTSLLDRHARVVGVAFERADPALFRVRDKIDELACRWAELHRRGLFDCLADVQAARVNKFERRFDFISILRGEASPTQANYVQADDVVALSCGDERRNIFAEGGAALGHNEPPDVHVLMKEAGAATKRAAIHANVSAKQTIVRDDDIVSDFAVVPDVRADHEKILVPDFGDASLGASAVNRAMLANHIFVSNCNMRFAFGRK